MLLSFQVSAEQVEVVSVNILLYFLLTVYLDLLVLNFNGDCLFMDFGVSFYKNEHFVVTGEFI